MKTKKVLTLVFLVFFVGGMFAAPFLFDVAAADTTAAEPDRLEILSEITGFLASDIPLTEDCTYDPYYEVYLCEDTSPLPLRLSDPKARNKALGMLLDTGVLIIPDSTGKRLMVFNPFTGDLIDPNFILLDADATGTVVHAILGPNQDSFLISDQTRDVVHEYDLHGNYLGVFAPAGGANVDILDNIRGIALRPNGNLLVTVAASANANAIAEFDTEGNYLGNFVSSGSGELDSPYDIYQRPGEDWLVSGIDSDLIHRYNLDTGAFLDNLAPVDTFPQQLTQAHTNILAGNFSGTQAGVMEFTAAGTLVDIYNPPQTSFYRGVYELPNGNILSSTSGGVYEISRSGELVSTKYTGQSRFIEHIVIQPTNILLNKTVGLDSEICAETAEIIVPIGTEVTYCFTVENIGGTTLSLHDLGDSYLGILLDGFNHSLEPGSAYSIMVEAVIEGDATDIAIWRSYNPGPEDQSLAIAYTTVHALQYGVELDPEVITGSGDPGETVEYSLTLTNTGDLHDTVLILPGESEWEVHLPETSYELEMGESVEVFAYVTIPADALADQSDEVVIVAVSQGFGSQSASVSLMTTANVVYGVTLLPETVRGFGNAGDTVEYTLTLTNTGNKADAFNITAGVSQWQVDLPETRFELEAGESTPVVVGVTIPGIIIPGSTDMVVISAVSEGDSRVSARSTLTTTGGAIFGVLLEPKETGRLGKPGEVVEYSLTLTNTGNTSDTIEVTLDGNRWVTHLPVSTFELEQGASAQVVIQVTVPLEAAGGERDTVTVNATSEGNPDESASSTLTTVAEEDTFWLFLPLIFYAYTP